MSPAASSTPRWWAARFPGSPASLHQLLERPVAERERIDHREAVTVTEGRVDRGAFVDVHDSHDTDSIIVESM